MQSEAIRAIRCPLSESFLIQIPSEKAKLFWTKNTNRGSGWERKRIIKSRKSHDNVPLTLINVAVALHMSQPCTLIHFIDDLYVH